MCSEVFLARLLSFQLPVAQKVPWTQEQQLFMDFSSMNLLFFLNICRLLASKAGCGQEFCSWAVLWESVPFCLFQTCPEPVPFGALRFFVREKTCFQFPFLALITFPSCPSHLSLKDSSLITLSQKLVHTSSCSHCPSPKVPRSVQEWCKSLECLHIVFSFVFHFSPSHS